MHFRSQLFNRLLCSVGAIAYVALIGWLLALNTSSDTDSRFQYRPINPQEFARKCSIEAGVTENPPGERISARQTDLLSNCMDRELARARAGK